MNRQSFTRSPGYLYPIIGYPDRFFWTGTTSSGQQVLMVIKFPDIVALFFDQEGELQEIIERPLAASTVILAEQVGIREAFARQTDPTLLSWITEFGFQEGPIEVKRFFLPEYHIGIIDFPPSFQEVIINPTAFSIDEQLIASSERERWFNDGLFQLWLNDKKELWIAKDGQIDSS
jgi:hypothetical protein